MTDKTAIVLGGSAGIGHAVVTHLLERGYRVGIIARGEDRLKKLEARHAGKVKTHVADAADAEAVETAAADLVEALGTPDIWVNSAMATVFAPFDEVQPTEFERITDVTYHGQVNGTRAALRHMTHGNIVMIGSGLSYRSVPGQSAYCGAKHAINGFMSSLRSELIRDNSKVALSLVQLPAVNTPQFDWARARLSNKPQPAPPIFSPDVAAQAVLRAIDTNAREIIVGRSVVGLIFGNMVLPNYFDRQMAKSGTEAQKSDDPPKPELDNLMTPATYPAQSEGSYSDRAEAKGLIIDGDTARYALVALGLGVPFVLGLILG